MCGFPGTPFPGLRNTLAPTIWGATMRDVSLSGRPLTRLACVIAALLPLAVSDGASADEAGVSFWLQGQYGSFAATPSNPGLSFESTAYHAKDGRERRRKFCTRRRISGRHEVADGFRHGDSDLCVRNAGLGWTSSRRNDGSVRAQHHLGVGNADRTGRSLAVGKPFRLCRRIRRPVPGRYVEMESRRAQLHGLCDGRGSRRRLRSHPPGDHGTGALGDRRGRRLHLSERATRI